MVDVAHGHVMPYTRGGKASIDESATVGLSVTIFSSWCFLYESVLVTNPSDTIGAVTYSGSTPLMIFC